MQRYTYFSYFLLQNIACGYSLEIKNKNSTEIFQFLHLKKNLYGIYGHVCVLIRRKTLLTDFLSFLANLQRMASLCE